MSEFGIRFVSSPPLVCTPSFLAPRSSETILLAVPYRVPEALDAERFEVAQSKFSAARPMTSGRIIR